MADLASSSKVKYFIKIFLENKWFGQEQEGILPELLSSSVIV